MTLRGLAPYIWIAWDLLAVFIIFRRAQVCARKGFVATLMGFLAYVAAAAAAGYASKRIAAYLYDNVVKDMVRHILTREFNLALSSAGREGGNLLEAIPFALKLLMPDNGSPVADLAAGYGLTMESAISAEGAISSEGLIEELAAQIIDVVLKEPLTTVLNAVSFLLVFSLVAFFMRTLTRMFTGVNAIPVIGGVNTALGCIFGLFEAALMLYVGAFILRLLVTFSGPSLWWLSGEVMNATYIWSVFY